jgi:hypothetical protein
MVITSNYGSTATEFGQAAFEEESAAGVPEPSTVTLLGLGSLGLLGYGWRRWKEEAA